MVTTSDFLKNSTLIKYNYKEFEKQHYSTTKQIKLVDDDSCIKWLNTYGNNYLESFKEVIAQNNLDNFLVKLLTENHYNKVIELDNVFFVAIKILTTDKTTFSTQQMLFILSKDFLWSIQEKEGDYFEWIRERLKNGKGTIKSNKVDYLFFLILESVIDNYEIIFQKLADLNDELFITSKIKPTPEFTSLIELRKQEMYNFKKAARALRDVVVKLEKIATVHLKTKYFSELKEQANHLIYDVDSELQELESKINLVFSIQGHQLNEIMKMLTVFSVIFIPLTFLAGVYGMNFENMPELKFKYGYFVLLAVMAGIFVFIIWYFRKRKWF